MGKAALQHILPTEGNIAAFRALGQALAHRGQAEEPVKLTVTVTDREVPVTISPEAALTLTDLFGAIAAGLSIDLASEGIELTSDQAAEVLNVSQPYLENLLEQNEIENRKEGDGFRIRMGDLVAYKATIDRQREAALDELVAEAQESGAYDI